MNQRKAPGVNRGLNTNENLGRVRGEWPTRQRRSAEEIARNFVARTIPLLAELRQVRHRLDAYQNGGPRK